MKKYEITIEVNDNGTVAYMDILTNGINRVIIIDDGEQCSITQAIDYLKEDINQVDGSTSNTGEGSTPSLPIRYKPCTKNKC